MIKTGTSIGNAALRTTQHVALSAPIPPATGMSNGGMIGLAAGAAGMALTVMNTWKDTFGSQKNFSINAVFDSPGIAIGGGAALLLLAEKGGIANVGLLNGMRGGAAALIFGGLIGASAGAIQRFGTPIQPRENTNTLLQKPQFFQNIVPNSVADLQGIEIASGEVIRTNRSLKRISVYIDPSSNQKLQASSTLSDAIAHARAASQADDQNRSHAVIQTRDGAYNIVRLSGDLDQIDGRNYTNGNDHDSRYAPQIAKRQVSLQAVVGVEAHYVFPEGAGTTDPPQNPGEIPWITPNINRGSGSTLYPPSNADAVSDGVDE